MTTATEHAIRIRTILDLAAADARLVDADRAVTGIADALDALSIKSSYALVSLDAYAEALLDLDERRRYLAEHGPDAVDPYLTGEELTAALKHHGGDKGALRDRMLEDVEAQLAALIGESAPNPLEVAGIPIRIDDSVPDGTVLLVDTTAEAERDALRAVARDVVTDYTPECCDDLTGCACSMARLARLAGVADEAVAPGV